MKIIKTQTLDPGDKKIIFNLWNSEYPVNLNFHEIQDMDNYLNELPGLTYFLMKNDAQQMEGWAMTFNAGDEKWFAITISPGVQRTGKGTFLLDHLKSENEILNGWVIDHQNDHKQNGEPYRSPVLFYQKNGFQVFPETRLEIPTLSAVLISWRKHSIDKNIENKK